MFHMESQRRGQLWAGIKKGRDVTRRVNKIALKRSLREVRRIERRKWHWISHLEV